MRSLAPVNVVKRGRERWRSERGAELVEVALTMPLLLLVVLGIIEFGFVFQQYEVVTNAAREGARMAVLPHYTTDDATARALDYLQAGGLDRSLATVEPVPLAPIAVGSSGKCIVPIQVRVTYPHPIPFVGGIFTYFGGSSSALTLAATSTMRRETVAGSCP
jgi:Flp pilus assembly protein TadG